MRTIIMEEDGAGVVYSHAEQKAMEVGGRRQEGPGWPIQFWSELKSPISQPASARRGDASGRTEWSRLQTPEGGPPKMQVLRTCTGWRSSGGESAG